MFLLSSSARVSASVPWRRRAARLLLVAALGLAAFLGAMIVFDGESTWLEGIALVGLYVIIAASVWYGPPLSQ